MAASNSNQFHLIGKPLSKIDAINRKAAAIGSMRSAQLCANADFNGHYLKVYFNDYRGYYVCDYQWGERVVIARGEAEHVLAAAIVEFARQGRGASLNVELRDCDVALAAKFNLAAGAQPSHPVEEWWWPEINGAFEYERHGLAPAVGLLANAESLDAYNASIEAFFAERRAQRAGARAPAAAPQA